MGKKTKTKKISYIEKPKLKQNSVPKAKKKKNS